MTSLLALWWRERGLEAARDALARLSESGVEAVDVEGGLLLTAPPVRLDRADGGGAAWVPGGSSVRLTPGRLEATAGPLPLYPLYCCRSAGDSLVVVSTELEPLRAMGLSGPLDLARLAAWVAWCPDPFPGRTAFQSVRRLRAGERLTASDGGVRLDVSLPEVHGDYFERTPRDLAAELRRHLDGAVARAVGGARRVAVFVGGGLDSSGVMALALAQARDGRRGVEALAQVWASPGDDRPHLAALERALGIAAIRLPARDAAPWFLASLGADAQPQPYGAACGDMLLWSTARERGADVALGGYGGDLVLGGNASFASLALEGHPLRAVLEALRFRAPGDLPPAARLSEWLLRPLVRPLVPTDLLMRARRRGARRPWTTPRFLELLEPALRSIPRQPPLTTREWMAHFCTGPLFAELTMSWGQIARATGVCAVDVFRDRELVEFVARVEPLARAHAGASRGLYRLALEGLVPDSVRLRPDKALGHPLTAAAAVAAGALGRLEELASLEELAGLGLVEPAPFRETFSAWLRVLAQGERADPHPTDAEWHRVWPMLSVEAFLRAHREAGSAGRAGDGSTGGSMVRWITKRREL